MPPGKPINIIRQVCNVIKRFKFEELELAVIPYFPETSWNIVREILVENKKAFSTNNVVHIIERVLLSQLQDKVLQDRLSTLELIDISRHHKRRVWVGYAMTGQVELDPKYLLKMRDNIREQFRSINVQMDIKMETYNSVTFVYLRELKKKASPVHVAQPAFFALFVDQSHFFCTKNAISKNFVKVMTASLGHTGSKRLKLMGKDVRSLDKLYRKKQQGAVDINDIDIVPTYTDASTPKIKRTGLDFNQQSHRRKYVEKCFSEDPPNFEFLILHTKDQPWVDQDLSSKAPNERMDMSWEFRSLNIANYLTKLIEQQIVITPLPEYIFNLMKVGRNELTLARAS